MKPTRRAARVLCGVLLAAATAASALAPPPAGASTMPASPATFPQHPSTSDMELHHLSRRAHSEMPPALRAPPNPMAHVSVAHTFVVDTSADTNPVSPAAACAAGNSSTCSLRAAVADANADTGHVDAVSVPTGLHITLSNSFGVIVLSNSMFIDGTGATISGGGTNEIFDENTASAAVRIIGLELTGGTASKGGAINLTDGSLVLSGVDVTDNTASSEGAGVFELSGQLWVDHSSFSTNSASTSGGGIYVQGGSSQVEDTMFGGTSPSAGNMAPEGAGIYNNGGDVIVNDCRFDFNTSGQATYGAGVDVYNHAVMDLSNSSFDHTSATAGGKGVDIVADEVTDLAGITIDHTSVTGAGSVNGGAIYANGYTTDLTDVRIDNTSAPVTGAAIQGGAVYLASTKSSWDRGSIADTTNGGTADNDPTQGGALYTDSAEATIRGVAISNTTTKAPGGEVDGGAAYNSGNASYDGVSINGTSSLGATIEGGDVYNSSDLSLDNVQISPTIADSSNETGSVVEGGVLFNSGYLSIHSVNSDNSTATADLAATATPSTNVTEVEGGDFFNSDYVDADVMSFTNTTVSASGGNGFVEGGGLNNGGDYMNLNDTQVVGASVSADAYVEGGLFYNTEFVAAQNLTLGSATVSVPGTPTRAHRTTRGQFSRLQASWIS
ncbi:MAG TPA: hypothetical protein VG815_00010 [Chloroflexota bacterium]|nr:hypothetical protein [Chloroflexota bacterium]